MSIVGEIVLTVKFNKIMLKLNRVKLIVNLPGCKESKTEKFLFFEVQESKRKNSIKSIICLEDEIINLLIDESSRLLCCQTVSMQGLENWFPRLISNNQS